MQEKEVNIIVVDDEAHSRERIIRLLGSRIGVNVISQCVSGKQAIKDINLMRPDLVFLDIRLKDMTGFEVLKEVNTDYGPLVIFVTAYNEYAVKAFDFFAFDYLLKPFEDERFHKSIDRVFEEIELKKDNMFKSKLSRLLKHMESHEPVRLHSNNLKLPVRLGAKVEFVEQNEIKYVIASGYYAEIFTSEKKYLLRESLTNLISKLQSDFIRIHRSTIININFIRELEFNTYGEIHVIMQDGKGLKVSKSYKKSFQNRFDI